MQDALSTIRYRAGDAPVRLGLVLGSGLGHLVNAVDGVSFPNEDLLGFPRATVSGHTARRFVGTMEGVRVAVFNGREHYYEHGNAKAMHRPLQILRQPGADQILLTNAAGSLRPDIPPGDLMLLSDHINYNGLNALIGERTNARFVPMTDAHSPKMRAGLRRAAEVAGFPLKEGVYALYPGPSFETPAEIRMLKTLGADAVGMSTVPDVILAPFVGLKVAAISTITNMAAGMSDEKISHDHTKAKAPLGAAKLERILQEFLTRLR